METYSVFDKHGAELPEHSSRRGRTRDEAKRLVIALNKHGLSGPYKFIQN